MAPVEAFHAYEKEHMHLGAGVAEVQLNLEAMRKAVNVYLNPNRFAPPPDDLAQLLAQADPGGEDEDEADMSWAGLAQSRQRALAKVEKLERELEIALDQLGDERSLNAQLTSDLAKAEALVAKLQRQLDSSRAEAEIARLNRELAAWPKKARRQATLALEKGLEKAHTVRSTASDAQTVISAWTKQVEVSGVRRERDQLSSELAEVAQLKASLEEKLHDLEAELEDERFRHEKAQRELAIYKEKFGALVKSREEIARKAGDLLRLLLGEPIPIRRVFQEWHRACPSITPPEEAARIQERAESKTIFREGKPETITIKEKRRKVDTADSSAQADEESMPPIEAPDMQWLHDELAASRQETLHARNALARAARQHAEQQALAQARIETLDRELRAERADRAAERAKLDAQIRHLEEENRRLIQGDEYIVWMEGRVDTLERENDSLKAMRDTYTAQRRRVAPEKTGELCIRCARQIVWRDWMEAEEVTRPSSAGHKPGLETGPGDGRRRARARAARSRVLPHLKAGWM